MDRQVDALLGDMNKFSNAVESLLTSQQSQQAKVDARNRSKNARMDQVNVSPGGVSGHSTNNREQEKKMSELLKNNDHIY